MFNVQRCHNCGTPCDRVTLSARTTTFLIPRCQAPLPPSAGEAGYALRLQGKQCMEVALAGPDQMSELAVGVWLNPSKVWFNLHEVSRIHVKFSSRSDVLATVEIVAN